ncbi:hypothetical protein NN561_011303 [Cricetulus griseus]
MFLMRGEEKHEDFWGDTKKGESFRAPMFSYGIDGNGFSLGCSKNWRQVFGDEKKYWLVPVFSSLGDGCSFPTRLVGMDPEQASVANQNDYARSTGSNQPFPIKPLSESKNRLLDSESQWLENGAEEGVTRSGNNSRLVQMRITRLNKRYKMKWCDI